MSKGGCREKEQRSIFDLTVIVIGSRGIYWINKGVSLDRPILHTVFLFINKLWPIRFETHGRHAAWNQTTPSSTCSVALPTEMREKKSI